MKRRVPDREVLTAEIAGLSKASIKDLRERWKTLYGKAPSREIGRSFLIRAIAYRLQERAYGGLKPGDCWPGWQKRPRPDHRRERRPGWPDRAPS